MRETGARASLLDAILLLHPVPGVEEVHLGGADALGGGWGCRVQLSGPCREQSGNVERKSRKSRSPRGKGADLTPPCVSSLAFSHRPKASDGSLEPRHREYL